ncbi:MAG: outer membrane protein assembly factor BamD [Chitinophagaceae bacterium]|nr:MAG: outer membrane protein assembly factor BamD [Chitinophagaceae bacterium]
MKTRLSVLTISFLLLFFSLPALAQESMFYSDPYRTYRKGVENFENKNFVVARKYFEDVKVQLEQSNQRPPLFIETNTDFYLAVCAVELFQPDAEKLLKEYIAKYHEIPQKRFAYYQLGRYYFRNRQFADAITWFERVEIDDLENRDIAKFKFQLGYSYFTRQNMSLAKRNLRDVRNVQNRYYYPSNYYYGYIAFTEKDYDEALKSFERVEESRIYQRVIPYYISQIRFFRGEYEEVIRYLQPLIENRNLQYYNELRLILGRSYFELRNFSEALPHLEYYVENSRSVPKSDIYQLAFAQYQNKEYEKAIRNFRQLTTVEDSLGQQAMYILGDCYLKIGDKSASRNAFQQASRLDFDSFVKEQSLFNYGKLSYELGFEREAIQTLNAFIDNYPQSDHVEEARSLLTDAFLNAANYAEALRTIESISDRSPRILRVYQQVAFYRALELFNDNNLQEAYQLMDVSLRNPINGGLQALAYFWKGEIDYKLKRYPAAVQNYLNYVQIANREGAQNAEANLRNAYYGLGYSYLMQEDFRRALRNFNQVLETSQAGIASGQTGRQISNDALLRAADAHFILREYDEALAKYDRLIQANVSGTDYALLQKAMLFGLKNKPQDKISTLQSLIRNHSRSIYLDDAIYETGLTYLQLQDFNNAKTQFNTIVRNHRNSQFLANAYLNLGLINFNQGNFNDAVENYKQVIENFPRTEESREALSAVKEVSIEMGQPDVYIRILESTPGGQVSVSLKDSVTFMSAERYYINNDCANAIRALDQYLSEFSDGFFLLQATFFRAECLYREGRFEKALVDYETLINMPFTRYTERSLLRASSMNYNKFENYEKAFDQFKSLLDIATIKENNYNALLGLMRSAIYLDRFSDIQKYAAMLLEDPQATESHKTEAYFYLGKASFEQNKLDDAIVNFTITAERTRNILGAEARYHIGLIQFKRESYESSKATALEIINASPTYEKWLIKSLILLADNHYKLDENFQAKATLQTVLDNYQGEDLRAEAQMRLDKILKEEAEDSKIQTESYFDEFIEIDDIEEDNDDFFEQP